MGDKRFVVGVKLERNEVEEEDSLRARRCHNELDVCGPRLQFGRGERARHRSHQMGKGWKAALRSPQRIRQHSKTTWNFYAAIIQLTVEEIIYYDT